MAEHDQRHLDAVHLYALQALPSSEVAAVEARIAACEGCRQEMDSLRPVIDAFPVWPTDVLRPSARLWDRLARRIAAETGTAPLAARDERQPAPVWDEVAPGIFCQLLATDTARQQVSMLVRLAPGIDYPPHRHGGIEELYLLDGVLMVDDKRLHPGDYIRAEAGSVDHRVWSETGCTCVLLTSTRDVLF